MIELRLGDQVAQYDRTATAFAYAALKTGGAEDCGCETCLNFAAQRKDIYPPDFQALAERIGIDLMKEGEAYHCGKDDKTNKHYYGGWFYFIGKLVSPEQKQEWMRGESGVWRIDEVHGKEASGTPDNVFTCSITTSFPQPPEAFKGQPVLALSFDIKLPWVLKSVAEPN